MNLLHNQQSMSQTIHTAEAKKGISAFVEKAFPKKDTAQEPEWINGRAIVRCAVCNKPKAIRKTEWDRSDSKLFFCSIRHLGKWRSEEKKRIEKEMRAERNAPITVHCWFCGKAIERPAFRVRLGGKYGCKDDSCIIARKEYWNKKKNTYKTEKYRNDPAYREKQRQYSREDWKRIMQDEERHNKYNEKKRAVWKATYERRKEQYQAKARQKAGKITLGDLIKHKALAQPTWGTKGLWDGVGPWCRKYPEYTACVECDTTLYKHLARGVCYKCYNKLKVQSEETKQKKRETKIKNKELYSANRKRRIAEAKEWLRKAQNGEIQYATKEDEAIQMNILENLERIEQVSGDEILTTLYSEREHMDDAEWGDMEYGGVYLKKFDYK